MQSRSQKSSPGRKSVAAALWGLVDAFEFEILVLLIASLVWYTISSLVGASCPGSALLLMPASRNEAAGRCHALMH